MILYVLNQPLLCVLIKLASHKVQGELKLCVGIVLRSKQKFCMSTFQIRLELRMLVELTWPPKKVQYDHNITQLHLLFERIK